jgi:hypothetical protein
MATQTEDTIQSLALLLHDWRFLRRDQMSALLRLDDADVEQLLDQLIANGIIQRIPQVSVTGISQPTYALARRGANLVASALGIDRAGLGPSTRRSAVGPLFLEHTLSINDIRLAFHKAAQGNERHSLLAWRYEWEIADRIQDPRRPGVWLPVRPDGYLVYRTPTRQFHALIEADLGTVTNKRWAVRVQAYVAYRLSGTFRNHYGATSFRILTVTTTKRRLANLLRSTEKAGGQHLFWFTTWDDLATHSPFSSIWSVAGTSTSSSPTSGKRGSSSRGLPALDEISPAWRGA